MKVKLNNIYKKYGDHNYTLVLTSREKEILITTENGDEIASINVDTMVNSENKPIGFFVSFNTKEISPIEKNVASVFSEEIK